MENGNYNQSYRIDIRVIYDFIESVAVESQGSAAKHNNYLNICIMFVEAALYRYNDYPYYQIHEALGEYIFSEETIDKIIPEIMLMVARLCSPIPRGEVVYNIEWIYETYHLMIIPMIIPSTDLVVDEESFFEKLRVEIENGDYIPEKVRRMIGY